MFSLPVGLSALTFMAARDYALKEAKKKEQLAKIALNRVRRGRTPVIELVPGAKGGVTRQGLTSQRYRVPVALPAAQTPMPSQYEEDEFDLQKMSSVERSIGPSLPMDFSVPAGILSPTLIVISNSCETVVGWSRDYSR